jgi:hypothetical protein
MHTDRSANFGEMDTGFTGTGQVVGKDQLSVRHETLKFWIVSGMIIDRLINRARSGPEIKQKLAPFLT